MSNDPDERQLDEDGEPLEDDGVDPGGGGPPYGWPGNEDWEYDRARDDEAEEEWLRQARARRASS